MTSNKQIADFRRDVRKYWKKSGRHDLPWRSPSLKLLRTTTILDPYKILVSEVMLQQTQVARVIEKYKDFLRTFPTVKRLASAKLSDVLRVWSGLGYNRRAKYLHDAAKCIVRDHKGIVPNDVVSLRALPGMGPYTASAVRVFAFNLPDILIETNIRTAYFHHFFAKYKGPSFIKVRDVDLIPIATKCADGQDPREWHWALMDYGSHLKSIGVSNNSKSAHYVKQSKFKGSLREVRGAILRELHKGPSFITGLPFEKTRIEKAIVGLERDGLIEKEKGKWRIA